MSFKKFEGYLGKNRLYVEGFIPSVSQKKPSILCVGGAWDGSWIYRRFLRKMASKGFPVYAMNLRGYYRSEWNDVAQLSVGDYLEDILKVRQELNLINDVVLVGYSLSGPLLMLAVTSTPSLGLVLFDGDATKEVCLPVAENWYVPPVSTFTPTHDILNEMYAGKVSYNFFKYYAEIFKKSRLSGKVYIDIERRRLSVPPDKVTTPILLLGVDPKNESHRQMFHLYRMSWTVFSGYSHGSILFSPKNGPLFDFTERWIEKKFPTGQRLLFQKKNGSFVLKERDGYYELNYFSGWEKVKSVVRRLSFDYISDNGLEKKMAGRQNQEYIHTGRFYIPSGCGFELAPSDAEGLDRPSPKRLYAPTGCKGYLIDGRFYTTPPTYNKSKSVYKDAFFECPELEHTFHVRVRLPANYPAAAPYQVILFQDGQNVWTNAGAKGGWHADRAIEYLARHGRITEPVMVGVWCHKFRNRAYLPPPIARADVYVNFLKNRVVPYLRENYKITDDRRGIIVAGSSYGAVVSVYAGLYAPQVFGCVASFSFPYVNGSPITRWLKSLNKWPFEKLYIDSGTRWSQDQPNKDDYTKISWNLYEEAQTKGLIPGYTLYYQLGKNHFHNEIAWRQRLPRALEFLLYPE